MALVDNLLSFPFDMWDTQRLSGHRNVLNSIVSLSSLATVQISSQKNCVQLELFGVVGHQWVKSPSSIDQFSAVGNCLPVTFWDTVISTIASPCVRGSLANCRAPFWLELQRSCRWEQCPRALWCFHHCHTDLAVEQEHMNCLFPALGAAGLCCHQLGCFPTLPLPTRIADSCQSPSLIAQVFSTRKMFFSWKPHLDNPRMKGWICLFILQRAPKHLKQWPCSVFQQAPSTAGEGSDVQAAPELTLHFRDMVWDLFILTPQLRVAGPFTSQDCSGDGDWQSWTEEGFGSPLFTVNF